MEYYLIDFENLLPASFPELKENQSIIIFTGEKQTKVKMGLVRSAQPLGKKVEWKEITGSGKNAADFHIAFYIGRISGKEPDASFKILSRDKGFDPLIKHLKALGTECDRLESFPIEKINKVSVSDVALDLAGHFKISDGKKLPKKIARLKAYIKNKIKKDDDAVDSILKVLVSEKQIEIEDGNVSYPLTGLNSK